MDKGPSTETDPATAEVVEEERKQPSLFQKFSHSTSGDTSPRSQDSIADRGSLKIGEHPRGKNAPALVPLLSAPLPSDSPSAMSPIDTPPSLVFVKRPFLQTQLSAPLPLHPNVHRPPSLSSEGISRAIPGQRIFHSMSDSPGAPPGHREQSPYEDVEEGKEAEENPSPAGQFDDASDESSSPDEHEKAELTRGTDHETNMHSSPGSESPGHPKPRVGAASRSSTMRPPLQARSRSSAFSLSTPKGNSRPSQPFSPNEETKKSEARTSHQGVFQLQGGGKRAIPFSVLSRGSSSDVSSSLPDGRNQIADTTRSSDGGDGEARDKRVRTQQNHHVLAPSSSLPPLSPEISSTFQQKASRPIQLHHTASNPIRTQVFSLPSPSSKKASVAQYSTTPLGYPTPGENQDGEPESHVAPPKKSEERGQRVPAIQLMPHSPASTSGGTPVTAEREAKVLAAGRLVRSADESPTATKLDSLLSPVSPDSLRGTSSFPEDSLSPLADRKREGAVDDAHLRASKAVSQDGKETKASVTAARPPSTKLPFREQRWEPPKVLRAASTASSGGTSTTSSSKSDTKEFRRRKRFLAGRKIGRLFRSGSFDVGSDNVSQSDGDDLTEAFDDPSISSRTAGEGSDGIHTASEEIPVARVAPGSPKKDANSSARGPHYGRVKKELSAGESGSAMPCDSASEDLLRVVKAASSGICRLTDVLDAMYAVTARVDSATLEALYKYLSTPAIVEYCVDILKRGTTPSSRGGVTVLDSNDPRTATNPYHFVLINAFVGGNSELRRALLHNPRARAELFSFFEEELRGLKANDKKQEHRTHDMGRILSALLLESPQEMTEHVAARKGFLVALVHNHISIPSVAEFVVELCAAKPLSSVENTSNELRYGAPNAAGIILLAKERICEALVDIFESCTDDVSLGGLTADRKRAREEACLFCLLELSKRTLVIPRFDKNNCAYGSRYIKQLNACLGRLSAFADSAHLAAVVQFALGALFGSPGDRGVALVAALDVVAELLNTVAIESESKLASTRMNMRRTPTAALERVLLDHGDIFSKLVALQVGQRGSLQQLRLTIIRTYQALFRSRNAETLRSLAASGITGILFQLMSTMEWSSMMQTKVVQCIELSFSASPPRHDGAREMQAAWLSAMDDGRALWAALLTPSQKEGRRRDCGYYGAYLRTGLGLRAAAAAAGGGGDCVRGLLAARGADEDFAAARAAVLDEAARLDGEALAGPRPEKTTASLLASAKALAAVSLDNLDAV